MFSNPDAIARWRDGKSQLADTSESKPSEAPMNIPSAEPWTELQYPFRPGFPFKYTSTRMFSRQLYETGKFTKDDAILLRFLIHSVSSIAKRLFMDRLRQIHDTEVQTIITLVEPLLESSDLEQTIEVRERRRQPFESKEEAEAPVVAGKLHWWIEQFLQELVEVLRMLDINDGDEILDRGDSTQTDYPNYDMAMLLCDDRMQNGKAAPRVRRYKWLFGYIFEYVYGVEAEDSVEQGSDAVDAPWRPYLDVPLNRLEEFLDLRSNPGHAAAGGPSSGNIPPPTHEKPPPTSQDQEATPSADLPQDPPAKSPEQLVESDQGRQPQPASSPERNRFPR